MHAVMMCVVLLLMVAGNNLYHLVSTRRTQWSCEQQQHVRVCNAEDRMGMTELSVPTPYP